MAGAKFMKNKWTSYKVDNLDEYMKATKVGFALRQIVPKLTINEQYEVTGDRWVINMTSTFKNHKYDFKLGESFVDTGPDGKTFKLTFTLDGDKLVARQERVKDGDVPSTFIREVQDNGDMICRCIAETGAECVRYYKAK